MVKTNNQKRVLRMREGCLKAHPPQPSDRAESWARQPSMGFFL